MSESSSADLTELARHIRRRLQKPASAPTSIPPRVIAQESKYSVAETVARIKTYLAAHKVPVFATYDHASNGDRPQNTVTLFSAKSPKMRPRALLASTAGQDAHSAPSS